MTSKHSYMYKTIILSLLVSVSLSTFGQSFTVVSKADNIKAFLKEKQNTIKSIQSSFIETTSNPMLKDPQVGNGSFYYSKPNKIRWENKSAKIVMLMDGKNTKLYENGKLNTNATAQRITSQIQKMIVGMISGDFLDSEEYAITFSQNTTAYKLELLPKNTKMAKEIKQMNLIFNRTSGLLNSLEMIQKDKASVVYLFNDMKLNKEISFATFTTL